MHETWTHNYRYTFSNGNSRLSDIRFNRPARNWVNIPTLPVTILEAIQIAEDFKMAERPKRNSYRDFFGSGADSYIKFYSFCMIRESPKPGL